MRQNKSCKCVCRLTSNVCNSRQIWNKDMCSCEYREILIDKEVCNKGFIWNLNNCNCECDKLSGIGEYLDYKNCVCRNTLVDKLVEECTKVINGDKIYNKTLDGTSSNDCTSCTIYIVLFGVFLTTSIIIGLIGL